MARLLPLRTLRTAATLCCLCLGLLLAGTPGVSRGQDAGSAPAVIRVSGEATVTAEPDLAVIDIGVLTEAVDAAAAASKNAERVDQVLRALRRALKADPHGRIETVRYSLEPRHRYPKGGGSPAIIGYTARNTLRVRTKQLQVVGTLIDSASAAGANQIERLDFRLEDPEPAHARALAEAALDARSRALAIASALGLHIVRIRSVESGAHVVLPVRRRSERVSALGRAAGTPVEPGGVEIRESVTLEVEVSD